MRSLPALLAMAALTACNNDPTQATFSQNVGAAFAECNAPEIRFLAGKHNFMTAFEPCGSNNFQAYTWSPDGTHLYFQLTYTGHVMDAEAPDKATIIVPTETPNGPAAWLHDSRIAVPVGPPEGSEINHVAVYDLGQPAPLFHPLPGLHQVQDTTVGVLPSELLFTAIKDGRRSIWSLDVHDGTLAEPFAWASSLDVQTFTYTPAAGVVAIGANGVVTLYDAVTGTAKGSWAPARRGVMHPDGNWLALEHDGEAVSIFYQRSWDELSEHARARELARAEKFEERLPEWYPKEVQPPNISLVEMATGERWMFTGFQGHAFQWYEARDYYASVILWGFEGKELNRNVVLGNLADRMRSMERGEEMLGVTRWRTEDEPTPAEAPAAAEAAQEEPTSIEVRFKAEGAE